MEPEKTAFKPQWLKEGSVTATGAASLWAAASSGADHQGNSVSSRNHSSWHNCEQSSQQSTSQRTSGSSGSQSFERDGIMKSNGYGNFGRNREREREREKDFNSRDRESRSRSDSRDRVNRSVTTDRSARDRVSRSVTTDRSGFESFSSCRPERDRLSRARTNADKEVINLSNDRTRNNIVTFEREFPHLNSEDRVPSPRITTPIQSLPSFTASDGWNSVLANVSVSNDSKKNTVASSLSQDPLSKHSKQPLSKQPEAVPNSGTALSMAETVMQAPQRIFFGPQLSIEAKKIEERTLRQNTLRPMTSPASKSCVTNLSKTKGARNGDPTVPTQQSLIPPANGSVRAPVKTDLSKLSLSGSFKILSREQNGTAHSAKDCPGNPVSPPSAPVASVEPQKRPFVIQKFKADTHDHPLCLLQGAYGDRKLNARDKHRFFESLRTKSSNGSSSVIESGCQPSSVVDVKQDPCLNLGNDLSLLHSGMEYMGNGKCLCEEANSSEGSQSHQSDSEGNISSSEPADIADGRSQHSLSELDDTGDEGFQVTLSDNAEGSLSSAPADSDDGYKISQSANEEASSSSEATEPGDEEYPDEAIFSTEELAFLISLGWSKDEIVQPLELEEIAECVRRSKELEQKLLSIEANPNIKIVLLYICQAELNEKPQESKFSGAKNVVGALERSY